MKINKDQYSVFFITFLTYSAFHANRKSYSLVKTNLQEWNNELFTNTYFGLMDSCFMFSYSMGLILMGFFADKVDKKKLLISGMFLSSFIMSIFSFASVLNINDKFFYLLLMCLNGIVQSVGWPITVSIIGNWFSEEQRGRIFGL